MATQRHDGTVVTPGGNVLRAEDFDPISSSPEKVCPSSDPFDMELDGAFEELERRQQEMEKENQIPSSPVMVSTDRKRVPLQELFTSSAHNTPTGKQQHQQQQQQQQPPPQLQPLTAFRQNSNIETFSQPFQAPTKWTSATKIDQLQPQPQPPSSPRWTSAAKIDQLQPPSSPLVEHPKRQRAAASAASNALKQIAELAQQRTYSTEAPIEIEEEPESVEHDDVTAEAPKKRKRRDNIPQEMVDAMNDYQAAISSSGGTVTENHKTNNNGFMSGRPARISLSEEQRSVFNLVVHRKKSVFFTGAAGTGKSVLLQNIIGELRKKYETQTQAVTEAANAGRKVTRVAVTASTGLAACHIGGVTLHSFAGIGLGKEPADKLLSKVRKNKKSLKRWKQVKVLVMDECSMVDGVLFDKLDYIAREIRKSDLPFGGIQLVITGDFYQLPPVPDKKNGQDESVFIFEAESWDRAVPNTVELRKVFRQKDSQFSDMLNEIRHGVVSPQSESVFKSLSRPVTPAEGVTATELFPRKIEVERANTQRLNALKTKEYTYRCEDWLHETFGRPESLANLMCVEELKLKQGSQVMMIKNIDETLVNGTIGTVVGFMSESSFSLMQPEHMSRYDIPKLTRVVEEFNQKIVENATQQEDELTTIYGPKKKENMSAALRRKHATLEKLKNNAYHMGAVYPLVRYVLPNGTFRIQLAQPEEWKVEDFDGKVIAKRTQVPLILAWALSIHKAQGQTLPYVKVDLSRAFETGQSYVALSRAVSLEGLQVTGFSSSKVMVNQKVVEFYQSLSGVDEDFGVASSPAQPPPSKVPKRARAAARDDKNLFDYFLPTANASAEPEPEPEPHEPHDDPQEAELAAIMDDTNVTNNYITN